MSIVKIMQSTLIRKKKRPIVHTKEMRRQVLDELHARPPLIGKVVALMLAALCLLFIVSYVHILPLLAAGKNDFPSIKGVAVQFFLSLGKEGVRDRLIQIEAIIAGVAVAIAAFSIKPRVQYSLKKTLVAQVVEIVRDGIRYDGIKNALVSLGVLAGLNANLYVLSTICGNRNPIDSIMAILVYGVSVIVITLPWLLEQSSSEPIVMYGRQLSYAMNFSAWWYLKGENKYSRLYLIGGDRVTLNAVSLTCRNIGRVVLSGGACATINFLVMKSFSLHRDASIMISSIQVTACAISAILPIGVADFIYGGVVKRENRLLSIWNLWMLGFSLMLISLSNVCVAALVIGLRSWAYLFFLVTSVIASADAAYFCLVSSGRIFGNPFLCTIFSTPEKYLAYVMDRKIRAIFSELKCYEEQIYLTNEDEEIKDMVEGILIPDSMSFGLDGKNGGIWKVRYALDESNKNQKYNVRSSVNALRKKFDNR